MTCNNDCNQGRRCNCSEFNQLDEKHYKFLNSDPFKHTAFTDDNLLENGVIMNGYLLFVSIVIILSLCSIVGGIYLWLI